MYGPYWVQAMIGFSRRAARWAISSMSRSLTAGGAKKAVQMMMSTPVSSSRASRAAPNMGVVGAGGQVHRVAAGREREARLPDPRYGFRCQSGHFQAHAPLHGGHVVGEHHAEAAGRGHHGHPAARCRIVQGQDLGGVAEFLVIEGALDAVLVQGAGYHGIPSRPGARCGSPRRSGRRRCGRP